MDKQEYKIKLDQINKLAEDGDFKGAADIVDTIDWRHVKSVRTLCMVAEIYEANKRYDDSIRILKYAYRRSSSSKTVLYRLAELSIRQNDIESARVYAQEFEELSPNDSSKYILRYKIARAEGRPLAEQIRILEELKEREYTERWAFELARLYYRSGQENKCVDECDDMILWFSEGRYVTKAMELKMQIRPLTPAQQKKYDNRYQKPAESVGTSQPTEFRNAQTAGLDSVEQVIRRNDEEDAEREEKEAMKAGAVIDRMDQAAAATVPEDRAAGSNRAVSKSAGGFSGLTDNGANRSVSQARLADSIRAVFSGMQDPETVRLEEAYDVPAEVFTDDDVEDYARTQTGDIPSYNIPTLEPESIRHGEVVTAPAAAETAAADGQMTLDDFPGGTTGTIDLKKLFAETSGQFASEIAAGGFEKTDDLIDENVPAAPVVETAASPAEEEIAVPEAETSAEEISGQVGEIVTEEISEQVEETAAEVSEQVEENAAEVSEQVEEAVEQAAEEMPASEEIGEESVIDLIADLDAEEPEETKETKETIDEIVEEVPAEPKTFDEIFDEIYNEPKEKEPAEEEPAGEETLEEEAEETVEIETPVEEASEKVIEEVEAPAEEIAEEAIEEVEAPAEEIAEEAIEEIEVPVEEAAEEAIEEIEAPVEETAEELIEEIEVPVEEIAEEVIDEIPEDLKPVPKEETVSEADIQAIIDDVTRELPTVDDEGNVTEAPLRIEVDREAVKADPDLGLTREYNFMEELQKAMSEGATMADAAEAVRARASMEAAGAVESTNVTISDTQDMPFEMMTNRKSLGETAAEMSDLTSVDEMYGDEEGSRSIIENIMEEPERLEIVEVEPRKLDEDEMKIFTYFSKIPGIAEQVTEAIADVHNNSGDKTSKSGNIVMIGRQGSGKTRLADALVLAICKDIGIGSAKLAHIIGEDLNKRDPAKIVAKMAGGFLVIEGAGALNDNTVAQLNAAMEFRTDDLVVILEDEKQDILNLLKANPEFAEKFSSYITIPVFTNDELVTFGKTYCKELGYKMDEMCVLALYTMIGDNQKDREPVTVGKVRDMIDAAIARAEKGSRRFGRKLSRKETDPSGRIILHEKDFNF